MKTTLQALRSLLVQGVRLIDAEASDKHPDPIDDACNVTRSASELAARAEDETTHAIADAARIGMAYADTKRGKREFLVSDVDAITEAANALAVFEAAPGFDWGEQEHTGWDEVCDALAQIVSDERPVKWPLVIARLLKGRKV